jgi:DNA repair exonuclease SbcCD ATPase subunit
MKKLQARRSHLEIASLALALAVLSVSPAALAKDPVESTEKAGNKAANNAADKIDDYRGNDSAVNKAEVKASLDAIDAELAHLDRLADSAPTPEQKNDIKARYKALKERRKDLGHDFTRARYDAFKADLKMETDKASNWSKDTFQNKPSATSAAGATSVAATNTADKIDDYRVNNSDVNKAEVKASLAKLDADIDLLEAKIDSVQDPMRKDELKANLKALKERRDELKSDFRKARYDALVADVKGQWNKITH